MQARRGVCIHLVCEVVPKNGRFSYFSENFISGFIEENPDEVWLGQSYKDKQQKDYQLTEWHLIKFYKDVAIVCICKIQKSKMVFKSWYILEDTKPRTGLLVYHKLKK